HFSHKRRVRAGESADSLTAPAPTLKYSGTLTAICMSVATAAEPPDEKRMKHGKPVTMTRTMLTPEDVALVIVPEVADVASDWLAPGRMAIILASTDMRDEIAHAAAGPACAREFHALVR